jgi:hypothetical protein
MPLAVCWVSTRMGCAPVDGSSNASLLDSFVAMPLEAWMRRSRARRTTAAFRRGEAVALRMSRRARPQDSWVYGEFAVAAGAARWQMTGGEPLALAAVAAERLVGNARSGAVVFQQRDGAEVSVSSGYADIVREALGEPARAEH